MEHIITGLQWYVVFLFSTVLHEAAHAYTAHRLGDDTAYNGGHVTINPLPHIKREPIGTVVVPILSFLLGGWMIGWASVPYNGSWAIRYPKKSAVMSAAGPAANLLLVLVAGLVIRIGTAAGVFYPPEAITFSHLVATHETGWIAATGSIVSLLFSLNLLLCLFNLFPVPPLDGSAIVPLFLKHETAQTYLDRMHHSPGGFFGLFLVWQVFDYVYDPVHIFVINLLYPGVHYR